MKDNSNNAKAAGGGIGSSGLLGLLFIALKLCGVIDWSWWWVLAPFWIPVALVAVIILIAAVIVIIKNAKNE